MGSDKKPILKSGVPNSALVDSDEEEASMITRETLKD